MYFNRFTQKSKKVIEISLEYARELGHNKVGSEHLLLGLAKEGEGVAAKVLLKLGITPKYIGDKNSLILDQCIHYLTLIFVLLL